MIFRFFYLGEGRMVLFFIEGGNNKRKGQLVFFEENRDDDFGFIYFQFEVLVRFQMEML